MTAAFVVTNPDGSAVDIQALPSEGWTPAWINPQEFAVTEEGRALLLDTTGHYYEAPVGRFVVQVGGEPLRV